MTGDPGTHAAWVLALAYGLSLLYEVYRATVRRGVSRYDSPGEVLRLGPLYLLAAILAGALVRNVSWAPWVALVFTVAAIVASIVYYNPVMLPARKPGLIDWAEDLVYTGLLFVAAALLLYDVGALPTMDP